MRHICAEHVLAFTMETAKATVGTAVEGVILLEWQIVTAVAAALSPAAATVAAAAAAKDLTLLQTHLTKIEYFLPAGDHDHLYRSQLLTPRTPHFHMHAHALPLAGHTLAHVHLLIARTPSYDTQAGALPRVRHTLSNL